MDVDALEQLMLAMGLDRPGAKERMRAIAHWVNRIKKEGSYSTNIPKEISALEKLRDMGIIHTEWKGGEVMAALTAKGKRLDKDFFQKGYYIRA